jgi:DNA mismatch repair protein MSH5
VLAYLQTRTSLEYLPGDTAALVAFKVKILETFALSDTMFVNAETLSALQILQTENHPNSHMQGSNMASSGAKESLSVYGLFQHLAHTPQGKHKLRQMFLRPSLDIEVIRERQTTLGVLLRSDNESSLTKIVASLKKIRNIRTVVIHLQKGVALTGRSSSIKRGVWASLQLFTFHALKIFEAVCELVNGESLAIVNKVCWYCLSTIM